MFAIELALGGQCQGAVFGFRFVHIEIVVFIAKICLVRIIDRVRTCEGIRVKTGITVIVGFLYSTHDNREILSGFCNGPVIGMIMPEICGTNPDLLTDIIMVNVLGRAT